MVKKNLAFKKGNVAFVFLCFYFALAVRPLSSRAQNPDTTKVNLLKEVRVSEYRLSKQILSAAAMQTLDAKDLKRINSLSVADAIRYFSGIQLKDYGGIGGLKTVNVRSMGTNHTAVFYDGVALGNAQNGQVDLGKYSLDNLEEITLISGQNTELLQPAKGYASASAIYLKTKTPSFADGKKYYLSTNFKSGDFGLINPSITYQFKLTNNITAGLSTEYVRANGKYKFRYTNGVYDTTAVRNNGDVDRFRLETSIFGKLKDKAEWRAQIYTSSSNRGLPGAIVANRFDYSQRIWDRDVFIQGSYKQTLTENLSLLLNTKLFYNYTRFVDPEYVTLNGFLDNRFKELESYFSASVSYRFNKILKMAFSSDYQYQDLEANIYRFVYPSRNTFLNVWSTALKTDRLELQGNILSTTIKDRVKLYGSGDDKQIFSPALLFSWRILPKDNLRIRGFYKDIFRMPTFNDLYYTFIGNTSLKPEFTKQYDLGFTYFKPFNSASLLPLEIQADVYYNQVKDKIVAQPGANLIRWIMYNIGRVDVKGLELTAKSGFKLGADLSVGTSLNYTYQIALDVTSVNDDNYKHQIPYIPKHSGSLLAKIDYKNWKLNYSFIYTGARYNQKTNIVYNYMQPWYTHDAAIGYQFMLQKNSFKINAEVNNLLNHFYDVIPNFPMPGRNYRITLNFSI
ncbi:MAG: TonB-dependent receptor [Pedobacter sp.]|nr:MAG: TonB-dependent receptor [Pedobacter sp.]